MKIRVKLNRAPKSNQIWTGGNMQIKHCTRENVNTFLNVPHFSTIMEDFFKHTVHVLG